MRLATLHFSGAFLCHVTRWISQMFPCTLEFTLSLVNSRYVASILFLRYAKYTTLSLVNSRVALTPCHSLTRMLLGCPRHCAAVLALGYGPRPRTC